jgi:hypothetical protein
MKREKRSEGIASEPYITRGDDASGTCLLYGKLFKRKFVLQQSVAVQFS